MEQNQINDDSKRNPTEQSEGADQPLLGDVRAMDKYVFDNWGGSSYKVKYQDDYENSELYVKYDEILDIIRKHIT